VQKRFNKEIDEFSLKIITKNYYIKNLNHQKITHH